MRALPLPSWHQPSRDMRFKLRQSTTVETTDDVARARAAEASYSAFIRTRRDEIPAALHRFFRRDFFHDGRIESVEHSRGYDGITLAIWCPNIKRSKGAGDFDFVSALFHARFFGVSRFTAEIDEHTDAVAGPATYLAGEIETLVDESSPPGDDSDRAMHSLIVETDRFWMSILFRSLSVEPVEPVAFQLMCSDAKFLIPWSID